MCIFCIEKVLYFSYSPTSTYMIWGIYPKLINRNLLYKCDEDGGGPRTLFCLVQLPLCLEILLQNKWNWWITIEQSKKQINVKLTVKTFLLFICCQLFSWDDSLWNYVFFNVLAQEFNTLWSMWKTYPWLNHTVWSEVCASSISM